MIKVSVLYPYSENSHFDIDYYVNTHAPMASKKIGSALKGFAIEHGSCGREPGSSPTYIAMGHMYYDSIEDFQTAYGSHAEVIRRDIPNYTDITPILQISDVRYSKTPHIE